MNNSANEATGLLPNEVLYGCRLREAGDLLVTSLSLEETRDAAQPKDLADARQILRCKAVDAIAYAAQRIKLRYDVTYEPLYLKEGDQVYIRLHKHFHVPGVINRKLHH